MVITICHTNDIFVATLIKRCKDRLTTVYKHIYKSYKVTYKLILVKVNVDWPCIWTYLQIQQSYTYRHILVKVDVDPKCPEKPINHSQTANIGLLTLCIVRFRITMSVIMLIIYYFPINMVIWVFFTLMYIYKSPSLHTSLNIFFSIGGCQTPSTLI